MVGLYASHKAAGLEIVGVPTTEFRQEYGRDEEVAKFVAGRGVTFPILSLQKINGEGACPLYAALREASGSDADVSWNFATYWTVSRSGEVKRHDKVSPARLEPVLQELLAEPAKL